MVGIINYGAGNIYSLQCALERVGAKHGLISNVEEFEQYDHYIIPGVGHASPAMEKLNNTGLVPLIKSTTKPLLGICLGMQLLTTFSEEGNTDLLHLIPLHTGRLKDTSLKIPQMGWNTVEAANNYGAHTLFKGLENEFFYFVHSYCVELSDVYTIGTTEYGQKFSSAIHKDNIFGVQFHPEKSGKAGELLLKNFVGL